MFLLISLLSVNLNQIKLNEKIMKVLSFDSYEKDFVFIVNNQQFKTSRIIADILSPKINKMHLTHPDINEYTINTKNPGNFTYFLQIINFHYNDIPKSQISFINEVAEILDNQFVEIQNDEDQMEITIDNVIDRIKMHEQYPHIYSKQISEEADFLASHFYMINISQEEPIYTMKKIVLDKIFNNTKLVLKSEDQLLNVINNIYKNDFNFSYMYNYVYFDSVSNEGVASFLQFIKFDHLTPKIWQSVSSRNKENQMIDVGSSVNSQRYAGKLFAYSSNNIDILYYLNKNSQIDEEVNFTASSNQKSNFDMTSVILNNFDSTSQSAFITSYYDEEQWLCIEFKKHSVIPTYYTLSSSKSGHNDLKSWVIEGSNDKINWTIIDEHNDCNSLKKKYSNTFSIKKQIEIKYFRIRMTGPNWDGNNVLKLLYVEIFGKLY